MKNCYTYCQSVSWDGIKDSKMSMVKIESTEGKNKRKKNSRPFHLIQHERDFAHKLKCFDVIERNGNDSTNLILHD